MRRQGAPMAGAKGQWAPMAGAKAHLSPVVMAMPDHLAHARLAVATAGAGFVEITDSVRAFVAQAEAGNGVVLAFVRHTSASLTIQENADPSVLADLARVLDQLAPRGGWEHATEGPDDMPAHIKSMLTATSLHVPVIDGALALGTWQGIYLVEHRARPHEREVLLQFIGGHR